MDTIARKPFQGVTNIIRFNWHFYVLTIVASCCLYALQFVLRPEFFWMINAASLSIIATTLSSLMASYYVYDFSGFYDLGWLNSLNVAEGSKIVNINAGFDETSGLLKRKFPKANLQIFDFYDPIKHTEVSIARARKAYTPYPGTKRITTNEVPLEAESADLILNIFAAHEIRDKTERIEYFRQLKKQLKRDGHCVVVEHLRDPINFLAYNIGFLHFFSYRQWQSDFNAAGMVVASVIKITPLVSIFILTKNNGITP
jgi:SAM-dependent methyltransferase